MAWPLRGARKASRSTDSSTAPTVSLRVRVEDYAGNPLANATGTVFKTILPRNTTRRIDLPTVTSKTAATLPSKSDGIVTTDPLPKKAAYVLEVTAAGFSPELTRWTHPDQKGMVDLPAVRLRRLGKMAGTVVNRRGQPIANVTVIRAGNVPKRLEAITGRDGNDLASGLSQPQPRLALLRQRDVRKIVRRPYGYPKDQDREEVHTLRS